MSGAPWWKGARGEWYVVVQVVLFVVIAIGPRNAPGWPAWPEPWATVASAAGWVLVAVGACLAVAGVVALGRNLSVLPDPVRGAPLVVSGPYRIVRNPIYSGLILGAFGWGLAVHGTLTLLYAVALFVFFDIKSRREERLLGERFPQYDEYQRRVRKLLPWIY